MSLYETLKANTYGLVCHCTGSNSHAAESAGYADVYDLLMSDVDHLRVQQFLERLPDEPGMGKRECEVLLDGLAAEYRGCDTWLEVREGGVKQSVLQRLDTDV